MAWIVKGKQFQFNYFKQQPLLSLFLQQNSAQNLLVQIDQLKRRSTRRNPVVISIREILCKRPSVRASTLPPVLPHHSTANVKSHTF